MESGKIFVGSDHAGLGLKKTLFTQLQTAFPSLEFEDCGTHDETSTDYPDYARRVARGVVDSRGRGILVCGSGIGMAIAANKIKGVRAALAWDVTSARLSREHNDANILCLGARLIGQDVALEAAKIWLGTAFQGGRHEKRIDLITRLEKEEK